MIERLLGVVWRALPAAAARLLRRRHYGAVTRCPRTAAPEAERLARRGRLVILLKGTHPTWLLAPCPCRCGEILRVNLMPSGAPAWQLSEDASGRTTVWPSLIVTACGSHFWITAGSVRWV